MTQHPTKLVFKSQPSFMAINDKICTAKEIGDLPAFDPQQIHLTSTDLICD